MAEAGGDRTHLVEDEGGRGLPMRSIKSDQPKMSLQQAVRDGREEIVKTWLTSLIGRKKKHIIDGKDSYGFTAMHYAARFNRFKIMQLLLSNDADPEIRTEEGLTPLHYAARYTPLSHGTSNDDELAPVTLHSTSRQIMQFLITLCRVNVNVQDVYGLTPLHLACSRGNRAAVEALVNAGNININIQDKKDETPLHAACLLGDPYIVEQLLRKDADCLLKNIENVTPLHIACQEGHIEIVNLIMRLRFSQRKELLNAYDMEFNFPLHLACESGEMEIVKVLFLNQADPNVIKIHDITPLHITAKEGFTNVAEVLLQYEGLAVDVTDENLLTPLHYAARHNNTSMIKFLLKKGADIEAQDVDSYTPLLIAVAHGQLQAMDVLIESGACIDDVDRNGKSVIFIAAERNQTEILKSLILGAHEAVGNSLVSTVDSTNNTPLHIACEKGNLEAIKILLRSEEIKLDARNEFDRTPMHMAANEGHTNVILELGRYCRQRKLDVVKDEDDDANTPLHLACINGHYNASKALLGAGADPDARNVRQWTSLDCAADKGREKIVQLLIDAEADIDPKDIASVTPLQLACQQGHLKVAKLLMENGAKASIRNASELNALDIAVENGNKDVAMMIIKSPQWQSALRNVTQYPNGKFTTPMRRIIKQMPSVAEEVFNRCTTTNEDEATIDSAAFKIEFNYEFLEDFREPPRHHIFSIDDTASIADIDDEKTVILEPIDAEHTGFQTSWGPVGYSSKYHTLQILARSKSQELLRHPLIASLLNYKWLSYGQWIYFANVFIQFTFVIFLTSFALTVLSPTTQTCISVFSGANETDCTAENSRANQIYVPIGATIVILFAAIKLTFEFFQFVKFRLKYFLDWVNYLEICLFVFSILFAAIYFTDCFCPKNFQWQLGAIAVFLSWIDLVIIIRKFPVTGIYVVMFMNIFYIFLKLAFLAVLLILAFGLSFYMVFYNPMNIVLNIRRPFQDPGRSLIKTMTMTTGEFEFDSLFRQTGENANVPDIQFPVVSYILWVLFLILMPILLTNLLVGLAVDDIKGIQESASINRLALRAELTLSVEEYIPARLRRRLFIGRRVMYPNRQSGFVEYIRYNLLGLFRFDSVENIKSALNPQPEPIEEVQDQNRQLSEQVDELRRTLEHVSEQNERLAQLITAIAENQGMALEPTMSVHSLSVDPDRTARDRSVSVPLSEM